jgi:hypothetical protein
MLNIYILKMIALKKSGKLGLKKTMLNSVSNAWFDSFFIFIAWWPAAKADFY